MGRVLCFAAEPDGDAAVFGEAEGEPAALGIVCAASGMESARLAMQKMPARSSLVLIIF